MLYPPVVEEILFSTPLIRSLVKCVGHSELFAAVPKQYEWVLENNPYLTAQLLYDKNPSKSITGFRDLRADYLLDFTGSANIRWFKNRLRVMDFSLPSKIVREFRAMENRKAALGFYLKSSFDLLRVFDLEEDGDKIDFFYGHNESFLRQSIPGSFIGNYAVIDIPDEIDKGVDIDSQLSELISRIERPVVLCGLEKWRGTGEEVMRRTGCTILSTCGDFTLQEQVFVRAGARVLINIEKGRELWSMVFDKSHYYIDIAALPEGWNNQVKEIRTEMRKDVQ